jgi:hypothetical protein
MATIRVLAIVAAVSSVVAPGGAAAIELMPNFDKLMPKAVGTSPSTNAPLSAPHPGSGTEDGAVTYPAGTIANYVSKAPRLVMSVSTDRGIYRDGESVTVNGRVENLDGGDAQSVVELVIYRILPTEPSATAKGPEPAPESAKAPAERTRAVYRTLIETKGDFKDTGYIVQFAGSDAKFLKSDLVEFSVEANVRPIGNGFGPLDSRDAPLYATTSFSAERVGIVRILAVLLYPVAGALLVLIIVYLVFMAQSRKRSARWTLFAVYVVGLFSLLGALGGPMLVSSSRSTETLLRETPVGLAKTALSVGGDVQWVVNIGGVVNEANVTGGYSVPLFVVILSLVGGVISMLLKLPDFLAEYDLIQEGADGEIAAVAQLRAGVFRQFVYIITAPFLGLGVYSISALAEYRNAFALSVMALAVGFVSQQIVDAMMSFSTNVLSRGVDASKARRADAPPDPQVAANVAGTNAAAAASANGGLPDAAANQAEYKHAV